MEKELALANIESLISGQSTALKDNDRTYMVLGYLRCLFDLDVITAEEFDFYQLKNLAE